jgi:hypothetical protein
MQHHDEQHVQSTPHGPWHRHSTSTAAAAMSDDGTTEDLLLPGDMALSKEAIVKALAKPAVWGVGDKKRAVLVALVVNRDTLLARVGEASQDQKATLAKWIPIAEKAVRNQRFKVVNIVEHLYEISVILDAYHCSPFSRSMRSDPLKQAFADIQSMMGQARQDAETSLLDESNSSRVKLLPRELDRLYLVDGHKPHDEMCQQCAFCGHEFLDEPNSNGPALVEKSQKLLAYDRHQHFHG